MWLLASIPSPGSAAIEIGPLQLRAYGLMIALGILAAIWLAARRWEQQGHNREDIHRMALWVIPGALIGARLYHVVTDFQRFDDNLEEIPYIWEGGLGIWGGVAAGIAVGSWYARRHGMDVASLADAVAPALPLGQAIGRLGNWFNQELYGRPTDLPWGLEIDPDHRVPGYESYDTFHPTFLYEAIWNLGLMAFLIWVAPRLFPRLRPGRLLSLYVIGYTLGRLWIELVRIDSANEILGQRVNVWVSLLVMAAGFVSLFVGGRPADQAPAGQAPAGQAPEGQAPEGQAPAARSTADTLPDGDRTVSSRASPPDD